MPEAPPLPSHDGDALNSRTPSRGHAAYLEIRRRIVELEMSPGSAFTEGALATDLGLSKTPIRDALRRLVSERFVTVASRSGYLVAPVTLKEARRLFELRAIVEPESAALAATRITDEAAPFLDELCRESYDPADAASISQFLAVNTRFHHGIAVASDNPRLAAIVEEVLMQMERLIRLRVVLTEEPEGLIHEHEQLLAAIKRGDTDRAREHSLEQVRASERTVLDALSSSSAVQSAVVGLPSAAR